MTIDKTRHRCFLDVEIDGESVGRIVVELFSDICPITCENFRALCTGERGRDPSGLSLHYKGVPFHRVVKGFMIQGGDFVAGNGTGGESIYGGNFKDENFDLSHEKPFMLSMANRGKDSNGSQFFITTRIAPHLDGRNTVFGRVLSGEDVVTEIENLPTDQASRPMKLVVIANCGELVPSLKKKKRRKSMSDSVSGSEEGERREKTKKKKKHSKHSRRHKRVHDREEMEDPIMQREEDMGCHIDPEEIPTVPVNNFLLRRSSPFGDARRDINWEYRNKPSKSRSGRRIKGRGFMRYRTPSGSRSRSRSETPPHWRQATRNLKKIEDVLPLIEAAAEEKSPTPPPADEEDREEALEIVPQRPSVQSRLGKGARYDPDSRRDSRFPTPENRRNRVQGRGFSPPLREVTRPGPVKSMVTVTSSFHNKESRNHKSGDSRNQRPMESKNHRSGDSRNQRQMESKDHRSGESKNHRLAESKDYRGVESRDERQGESKDYRAVESKDQRQGESKDLRSSDLRDQRSGQQRSYRRGRQSPSPQRKVEEKRSGHVSRQHDSMKHQDDRRSTNETLSKKVTVKSEKSRDERHREVQSSHSRRSHREAVQSEEHIEERSTQEVSHERSHVRKKDTNVIDPKPSEKSPSHSKTGFKSSTIQSLTQNLLQYADMADSPDEEESPKLANTGKPEDDLVPPGTEDDIPFLKEKLRRTVQEAIAESIDIEKIMAASRRSPTPPVVVKKKEKRRWDVRKHQPEAAREEVAEVIAAQPQEPVRIKSEREVEERKAAFRIAESERAAKERRDLAMREEPADVHVRQVIEKSVIQPADESHALLDKLIRFRGSADAPPKEAVGQRPRSPSPPVVVKTRRSPSNSPVKAKSPNRMSKSESSSPDRTAKSPEKKIRRASKSPERRSSGSKSPTRKIRRSRSGTKSPVRAGGSRSLRKNRRSTSKGRHRRRSPSPRNRGGRSRSRSARRGGGYPRAFRDRVRRSRSPVRRRKDSSSSSGSSSSRSSSRRRSVKKGKGRKSSSSSSSSSGSSSS